MTYRGILATLDGSRLSEAVLPVVADLVAGTEAVVTLLAVGEVPGATVKLPRETAQPDIFLALSGPAMRFVSTTPGYAETKSQAIQRSEQDLLRYLEEKAASLRSRGIDVRTATRLGDPVKRIVEYARRPEIDLVAMATHGHTGLRTVIYGSVAGRVLGSVDRPMLLVRPRYGDHGWPEELTATRVEDTRRGEAAPAGER